MSEQTIHVQEEMMEGAGNKSTTQWLTVRGDEVVDTVNRLVKGVVVRKITVKDRNGKKFMEIPLVLGAAGMLIIGPWTAAVLAAAWLTQMSILIEYEGAAQVQE